MREPPFKVGWGEGKGKERNTYTHAWQWMDALRCAALRCNGYTAMDALRCNGMEMGRDFAVVVSCFFLLFKERARA